MTTNVAARPELYGLVLAGGHSRRMGQDKAALKYNGVPALEHAVSTLATELGQVFVSVRPDQQADPLRAAFPVIADTLTDAGPISGMLAAHAAYPQAAWLVVACDLPLLNQTAIACLVAGRASDKGATVFQSAEGFAEPLCAIYEPDTLAYFRDTYFQQRLDGAPQQGPRVLLETLDIRCLELPNPELLDNINTPADLQRLRGPRN
jgi:molybdopterin-guanine dinucleotide biosynthesis protein A